MSNPTTGWDQVPVYGRWLLDPATNPPAVGQVTFSIKSRINLSNGDAIYPSGISRTVSLDGTGRISTYLPAVDDPNILQHEWSVFVREEVGRVTEYTIQPRMYMLDLDPPGLNLGSVIVDQIPGPTAAVLRGVPGGLAVLDADGDVVDATGEKVTALDLSLLAQPRSTWAAGTAYPAWSNVIYQQGFYTATKAIPARSSFTEADGWWLTGFDAGTM